MTRPKDPNVHLFEMTSGAIFETQRDLSPIDVAFIDGLHTFNQTLRDLLNVLCVLSPHGVIILDDVMPTNYVESIGELSLLSRVRVKTADPSRAWMGDVYKIVFFVEAYLPLLDFHMVEETRAQLVCWRRASARNVGLAFAQKLSDIASSEYGHVLVEYDRFRLLSLDAIIKKYVRDQN